MGYLFNFYFIGNRERYFFFGIVIFMFLMIIWLLKNFGVNSCKGDFC